MYGFSRRSPAAVLSLLGPQAEPIQVQSPFHPQPQTIIRCQSNSLWRRRMLGHGCNIIMILLPCGEGNTRSIDWQAGQGKMSEFDCPTDASVAPSSSSSSSSSSYNHGHHRRRRRCHHHHRF